MLNYEWNYSLGDIIVTWRYTRTCLTQRSKLLNAKIKRMKPTILTYYTHYGIEQRAETQKVKYPVPPKRLDTEQTNCCWNRRWDKECSKLQREHGTTGWGSRPYSTQLTLTSKQQTAVFIQHLMWEDITPFIAKISDRKNHVGELHRGCSSFDFNWHLLHI